MNTFSGGTGLHLVPSNHNEVVEEASATPAATAAEVAAVADAYDPLMDCHGILAAAILNYNQISPEEQNIWREQGYLADLQELQDICEFVDSGSVMEEEEELPELP